MSLGLRDDDRMNDTEPNDFRIADYQREDDVRTALVQPCIAVVGLSPNPARDSHGVAAYMQHHGYKVIGVNPKETEILGQPCYPSLEAIPDKIDLVDVFRASDAVGPIVDSTIELGVPYIWLQLGVINPQAAANARAAGLGVVVDLCWKIEHARYGANPANQVD